MRTKFAIEKIECLHSIFIIKRNTVLKKQLINNSDPLLCLDSEFAAKHLFKLEARSNFLK